MMEIKEKLRNSIRAYILGDCLGVPYEFEKRGKFKPELFKGYGTYNKPAGTWSDDTTVLLCLLDAFSQENSIEVYKNNLKRWFFGGEFTIDGCFDIGEQTSEAIRRDFNSPKSDRMGNGALFYCLPLSIVSLLEDIDFEEWCSITHNNSNCFKQVRSMVFHLKNLWLDNLDPIETNRNYRNKGDVVNTYRLVVHEFIEARGKETSLTEDLLKVISYGGDTDTNAAFLGALLGTEKPVQKEDWERVRENGYVDEIIDRFLERF